MCCWISFWLARPKLLPLKYPRHVDLCVAATARLFRCTRYSRGRFLKQVTGTKLTYWQLELLEFTFGFYRQVEQTISWHTMPLWAKFTFSRTKNQDDACWERCWDVIFPRECSSHDLKIWLAFKWYFCVILFQIDRILTKVVYYLRAYTDSKWYWLIFQNLFQLTSQAS